MGEIRFVGIGAHSFASSPTHRPDMIEIVFKKRHLIIFNVIGNKNNQTSVFDADREIPTLGSADNAGNSVNLVSRIIRLPSG